MVKTDASKSVRFEATSLMFMTQWSINTDSDIRPNAVQPRQPVTRRKISNEKINYRRTSDILYRSVSFYKIL